MLNLLLPLTEPYRLIDAFFIFCGLYADSKLFWMIIYEYKKEGDGEKYLKYGKKLVPQEIGYILKYLQWKLRYNLIVP